MCRRNTRHPSRSTAPSICTRLIDLVERGCAPHLAARILAPLERETKPC
jgi:hypothetical protein